MTDEPESQKPPRSHWTALKDEVLERMWPDPTIPTDVIAKELDVTEAAAAMRASRKHLYRGQPLARPPRPKRKDEGVATWLASLSGRVASPDAPPGPEGLTEEIGRQWLNDPVAFIQALAPHPLLPYQEEWLRAIATNRYTLLLSSRQIGKSTISVFYGLWRCFVYPGSQVLVVAHSVDQATIDLEHARRFVYERPQLKADVIELSKTAIRLVNGSRLLVVPVGPEGSSARGYRADVLIVDEASRIPDASFPAFLPSVAAVPDPKIIMCTTPRAMTGFVWNASRTPTWKVLVTTYEPALKAGLISQDFINEQRAILPEDAFRMEYLAEFCDESVSAFPYALLDAATDEDLVLEDT